MFGRLPGPGRGAVAPTGAHHAAAHNPEELSTLQSFKRRVTMVVAVPLTRETAEMMRASQRRAARAKKKAERKRQKEIEEAARRARAEGTEVIDNRPIAPLNALFRIPSKSYRIL